MNEVEANDARATSDFNAELATTREAEVAELKKAIQASQLAEASRGARGKIRNWPYCWLPRA